MGLRKSNRRVGPRSFAIYSAIVLSAVFLLLLVSPSLANHTPIQFTTSHGWLQMFTYAAPIIALMPALLVLALAVILFDVSTSVSTNARTNSNETKVLALTTLVGLAGSIAATYISSVIDDFAPGPWHSFWENIGTVMLFLAAAASLWLLNVQNFVYFPFWNQNDKRSADERQKYVRQRVFEKAYVINVAVAFGMAFLWSHASHRLHQVLGLSMVILLLALPAVVATRQKDG